MLFTASNSSRRAGQQVELVCSSLFTLVLIALEVVAILLAAERAAQTRITLKQAGQRTTKEQNIHQKNFSVQPSHTVAGSALEQAVINTCHQRP